MKNLNKTIFLLRAMPGAGKSTLIEQLNLKSNTISLDTFRELFSGQTLSKDGDVGIDQQYNHFIMRFFNAALIKRMSEGAIIIIDNLNVKVSDVNNYIRLGREYGYDVKIVDFELKNLDFYKLRNSGREVRKQLSDESISRIYNNFKNSDVSNSEAELISVEDFKYLIMKTSKDLIVNLSQYSTIHHIGDLFGCIEPLNELLKDFNDEDFYIFTGNYFDKGLHPELVFSALDKLKNKGNVVFLKGTFDSNLDYFCKDIDVNSDDFNINTKNKLLNYKAPLNDFRMKLKPYFIYKHLNNNVFVSSAGISTIPLHPQLINSSAFINGVENLSYDIGNAFNLNSPNGWFQVHGLRNSNSLSNNDINNRSFSLYDRVEYGGNLVELRLKFNSFEFFKYKNNNYNSVLNFNSKKDMFQTFLKSNDIDLSKCLNSIDDGDFKYFYFDNYFVNVYKENIYSIGKGNEDDYFAIVSENSISEVFITKDKNNELIFIGGDNSVYKNIDIDIEFKNIILELDVIAHCFISEGGNVSIFNVYRKDENKNKLKKNIYSKFINKKDLLIFKNEESFNGFIRAERKFKSVFISYMKK